MFGRYFADAKIFGTSVSGPNRDAQYGEVWAPGRTWDKSSVDNANAPKHEWRDMHLIQGANDIENTKFAIGGDPLQRENADPLMHMGPAHKRGPAIDRRLSRLNLNANDKQRGMAHAAGEEEYARVRQKAEDDEDAQFIAAFFDWMRGAGSADEYKRAHMNPLRVIGKGPISKHPTVLNTLASYERRRIDYHRKLAEMTATQGNTRLDPRGADIQDLWNYYKFVVHNLPPPDQGFPDGDEWRKDQREAGNRALPPEVLEARRGRPPGSLAGGPPPGPAPAPAPAPAAPAPAPPPGHELVQAFQPVMSELRRMLEEIRGPRPAPAPSPPRRGRKRPPTPQPKSTAVVPTPAAPTPPVVAKPAAPPPAGKKRAFDEKPAPAPMAVVPSPVAAPVAVDEPMAPRPKQAPKRPSEPKPGPTRLLEGAGAITPTRTNKRATDEERIKQRQDNLHMYEARRATVIEQMGKANQLVHRLGEALVEQQRTGGGEQRDTVNEFNKAVARARHLGARVEEEGERVERGRKRLQKVLTATESKRYRAADEPPAPMEGEGEAVDVDSDDDETVQYDDREEYTREQEDEYIAKDAAEAAKVEDEFYRQYKRYHQHLRRHGQGPTPAAAGAPPPGPRPYDPNASPEQVLGVDKDAGMAAVTRAWRKLNLLLHPDAIYRNTGESATKAQLDELKRVNDAYERIKKRFGL